MCFEIYSLKCCAMVMTNLGNKWYHSLLRTETFSIYCIECLIKALLSERNRIEFKNFFFFKVCNLFYYRHLNYLRQN